MSSPADNSKRISRDMESAKEKDRVPPPSLASSRRSSLNSLGAVCTDLTRSGNVPQLPFPNEPSIPSDIHDELPAKPPRRGEELLSPLRRALLQNEFAYTGANTSPRPIPTQHASHRLPPLILPHHSSPEVSPMFSPDSPGSPPNKPLPQLPGSAPSSPPVRSLMRERLKKTASDSNLRRIKPDESPIGNLTPRSRAQLLFSCFSKEDPKSTSKKFVQQVLFKKNVEATRVSFLDLYGRPIYNIYTLMSPSIANFEKIESALQEISGIESKEDQTKFQKLLVLWKDLVKTGKELLNEEADDGASFHHKNGLRIFLRVFDEINKDKDYKELLCAAMDGEDNVKRTVERLKAINERRIGNLFLYQHNHVIIETETAEDPIHHIDPRKIHTTFSRGEPKEGPAKVAYERIIVRKRSDARQPVVIKPEYIRFTSGDERLESLERWYMRLLEAIYSKDFLGDLRFDRADILKQVELLFSYEVAKKAVVKKEMKGEILNSDCELVPDYDLMHRQVLPELPCFHVLQALSNSSAASAHFALMHTMPRLFNFESQKFTEYSLKTFPRRGKQFTAEICIENQMLAVVSLRRLYDFVLILPTPSNSPKKALQQSRSNEVYLGCFWLESKCSPFHENTYSPWQIKMTPTDLILENEYPKHCKHHKDAIKFFRELVLEEFLNFKTGEFDLDNGATLFSERVNAELQE